MIRLDTKDDSVISGGCRDISLSGFAIEGGGLGEGGGLRSIKCHRSTSYPLFPVTLLADVAIFLTSKVV